MNDQEPGGGEQKQLSTKEGEPTLQSIAKSVAELKKGIISAAAYYETAQREEEFKGSFSKWWHKWHKGISDIVLIVIIGFQAYYAHQQWKESEVADRAWVVVNATSFQYVNDSDGVPRADAVLKFINSAPSPAFKVSREICAQVRDHEPQIDERPQEACRIDSLGLMGKDVPVTLEAADRTQRIAPNSLAFTAYQEGRHLYVWGRVTYETSANDGRHWTTFCLLNAGGQLGPCKAGNDGD